MGVTHGLSRICLPNLVGTPLGATHGHYIIRLPDHTLGAPMGVTHGLSRIHLPNLVGTPMGVTHGISIIRQPDI